MIDTATVDRIFEAADIVSVVSDYVSLKRRGANFWGTCPFHDEKTPSFSVSPAKNIYKCFGCGKGGNAVNFVMGVENLSYYEALLFLARKFHIEVKEKELTQEEKEQQTEKESLMSLTEWALNHFEENLKTQEGQAVGMSYFAHRGFREDIVKKFHLGYAMDKRDECTVEAQKAGYKLDYLEKTGLTIVKENNYVIDRFHGRVIFPIHSISGRVIAFGGRAIKKDEVAKYQNSPESDIYHKSYVLYGLYFAKNAITRKKKCYIVEGYADVISMVQAGVENIVAPCGTALTVQQIQQLRRILPSADAERSDDKHVTLLYDGDAAGMHAALKNGKMLLEEGLSVKVVVLPDTEDPDSFAQNHESSEVIRYLEGNEQDYVIFKINHYLAEARRDPMKMSQLIEDIASTIEVIPDEVKRSVYAKTASGMLGVDEKVLYSRINSINKKKRDEANGPSRAEVISKMQEVSVPEKDDVSETNVQRQSADVVEKELIRCLVRFGERRMEEQSPNGTVSEVSVVDYIKKDLEMDGLSFSNPIYQGMLADYHEKHKETPDLSAEFFFLRNLNTDYAKEAAEALSDPYPLSKIFDASQKTRIKMKSTTEADEYPKLVCYSLHNFKSNWLHNEINACMLRLRENLTTDEVTELLAKIKRLKESQNMFEKELGERHIHPSK